ncbi:MAG TPA: GNAT family N-acetyltransferase [Gemmatimonadales bacterium]|nr:GNAT family N-acetyltransferase [Gemmatimonadales bacterium]
MTVRLATATDADVLARLRWDLRTALAQPAGEQAEFLARCREWMRERLEEGGGWRCWVAVENGEVVGALWLQLIEKVPNPVGESETLGYITNVYVRPEARNRGLGSQLVAAAVAFCRALPVDTIVLWPTDESRSLYERHGFRPPKKLMELLVGGR